MEFKDVKKVLEREFAEMKKVKVKVYDEEGLLKHSRVYDPNLESEYNTLKELEKITIKDGLLELKESLNCFSENGKELFKEDIIVVDGVEYVALDYHDEFGLLIINGMGQRYIKGEKMRRSQIKCKF